MRFWEFGFLSSMFYLPYSVAEEIRTAATVKGFPSPFFSFTIIFINTVPNSISFLPTLLSKAHFASSAIFLASASQKRRRKSTTTYSSIFFPALDLLKI